MNIQDKINHALQKEEDWRLCKKKPDLYGACRMALNFLRPPLYQDTPIPTEKEVVKKLRLALGESDENLPFCVKYQSVDDRYTDGPIRY